LVDTALVSRVWVTVAPGVTVAFSMAERCPAATSNSRLIIQPATPGSVSVPRIRSRTTVKAGLVSTATRRLRASDTARASAFGPSSGTVRIPARSAATMSSTMPGRPAGR
jgi:hypothetical protein